MFQWSTRTFTMHSKSAVFLMECLGMSLTTPLLYIALSCQTSNIFLQLHTHKGNQTDPKSVFSNATLAGP